MKRIVLITFIIILCASCGNGNPYNCLLDEEVIHANDTIIQSEEFIADRTSFLSDFNEPLLEDFDSKAFRLSYHGGDSFTSKFIYRFNKTENGGDLVVKALYSEDSKDQYGVNDTTYTKTISDKQWEELELSFDSRCFWTMPLQGRLSPYNTYILEAYDPGSDNPTDRDYHIVVRSFPEDTSDYGQILEKIFYMEREED